MSQVRRPWSRTCASQGSIPQMPPPPMMPIPKTSPDPSRSTKGVISGFYISLEQTNMEQQKPPDQSNLARAWHLPQVTFCTRKNNTDPE